jgi:phospholipid-binding lipoprotein MlaA
MRATTGRLKWALLVPLALLGVPACAGDMGPAAVAAEKPAEAAARDPVATDGSGAPGAAGDPMDALAPAPVVPAPAQAAPPADPSPAAGAGSDPLFDDDSVGDYATEIGPATRAYQFVVPLQARMCARRFFRNLKTPVYLVNDVLQLRFRDAAETTAAFAMNSTFGFLGLFDAGIEFGWKQHPADFGETLGVFGVKSGPYLVIPLLGPSTVRDGAGDLVDRVFDPLTYVLGFSDMIFIGGSSGFVMREENAEALAALRSSSVDFYSALRSAYTQDREGQIAELRARLGWGPKNQQTAAAR